MDGAFETSIIVSAETALPLLENHSALHHKLVEALRSVYPTFYIAVIIVAATGATVEDPVNTQVGSVDPAISDNNGVANRATTETAVIRKNC